MQFNKFNSLQFIKFYKSTQIKNKSKLYNCKRDGKGRNARSRGYGLQQHLNPFLW